MKVPCPSPRCARAKLALGLLLTLGISFSQVGVLRADGGNPAGKAKSKQESKPRPKSKAKSKSKSKAKSITGSVVVAPDPEAGGKHLELFAVLLAEVLPTEFRTIDGTGNNETEPGWGSVNSVLLRKTAVEYEDGVDFPSGFSRRSPREISNACSAQDRVMPNAARMSDVLWAWGQFLDHDMDLTPTANPPEPYNIEIPAGDPVFDPQGMGGRLMGFARSAHVYEGGVRQQINAITAFIDASNVYGSDEGRARGLRTLDGTGRLRMSPGALLPFNEAGFDNAPDASPGFFLAGDVRANEQTVLAALHTVFVREHNVWARYFSRLFPLWDGDQIYELSRMMVGAEMQCITYNEFLPQFLGYGAIGPYAGYRPDVNPGIANAFSTAAFRIGHTMLPMTLLRLDKKGNPSKEGHLPLASAFFRPDALMVKDGVSAVLRGVSSQMAQEVDPLVVDAVRNMLFGPPGAGFDLVSLNIQRGRDHGLADYNQVREDYGLARLASFAEGNFDPAMRAKLEQVYDSVDEVDLWVGGLAERVVPGAMVGETFRAVLLDQFERLRDGDRFFYLNHLPPVLAALAEEQTLAVILRRNTTIKKELQDNVFLMP